MEIAHGRLTGSSAGSGFLWGFCPVWPGGVNTQGIFHGFQNIHSLSVSQTLWGDLCDAFFHFRFSSPKISTSVELCFPTDFSLESLCGGGC